MTQKKKAVKQTNTGKSSLDRLKNDQDKKLLAKQMKNTEDKKRFSRGHNKKAPENKDDI